MSTEIKQSYFDLMEFRNEYAKSRNRKRDFQKKMSKIDQIASNRNCQYLAKYQLRQKREVADNIKFDPDEPRFRAVKVFHKSCNGSLSYYDMQPITK